jgi:hypothetical protein
MSTLPAAQAARIFNHPAWVKLEATNAQEHNLGCLTWHNRRIDDQGTIVIGWVAEYQDGTQIPAVLSVVEVRFNDKLPEKSGIFLRVGLPAYPEFLVKALGGIVQTTSGDVFAVVGE